MIGIYIDNSDNFINRTPDLQKSPSILYIDAN